MNWGGKRKGEGNPMWGRKQSKHTKEKIRQSMLGKKLSIEHRIAMGKNRRDSQHHLWKGGITPSLNKIRGRIEIKLWREQVIKRDKGTYRKCGVKNKVMIAHHIKSFTLYPKLRTKLINGRCLCRSCHTKLHIKDLHKRYAKLGKTK